MPRGRGARAARGENEIRRGAGRGGNVNRRGAGHGRNEDRPGAARPAGPRLRGRSRSSLRQ